MERQGYVEYDSNNSGGSWWLSDEDWKALEAAGWKVRWSWFQNAYTDGGARYAYDEDGTPKLERSTGTGLGRTPEEGARWLGALATKAYRSGLSMRDAADEWERVTGKIPTDPGCPCCGQPHTFTEYDADGKLVRSGPETYYSAAWA